jgi:glutathionylspermidine synthase
MSASATDYAAYADRLLEGGVLTDPWYEGNPRFRAAPVWLTPSEARALGRAAEDVAFVYDEVARACAAAPELVDRFFELTPAQKIMWQASQPMWHGVARADAFFTPDGRIRICELNSDTPTGEPEAVILGQLARAEHPGGVDPNVDLEARFAQMVETLAAAALEEGFDRTLGIVYPTDITEDLPLVRLYTQWLQARGWRVVLGSPFNLTPASGGRVALLGTPCSVLVRHYKTDWWGERVPAWRDGEPFDDPLPLAGPLAAALGAAARGRCAIVNPFGSVLTQNKRAMAFMWEEIDRLSPAARAIVREYVPQTLRLDAVFEEQLCFEREQWVLKSDYGCEGDEVIIGKLTTPEVWRASVRLAIPGRWIAQRYFETATDADGKTVNHGVYVVAGQAAGHYARVHEGATDIAALSAPVLVRSGEAASA